MTLVMMLVTPYGVWSSADHRLTEFPSGDPITNLSVKQIAIACRDGSALVSYTGIGRVGRIDVSEWLRRVLRGESRTIDETQIDLREQATARIGLPAYRLDVQHCFLIGAFYAEHPWAIEIRNLQPSTALTVGGVQAQFTSGGVDATEPVLMVGGSGRDAIGSDDLDLLTRIRKARPKRPEDYMHVLAGVNRRAADVDRRRRSRKASGDRGTVSSSCTVTFMPPAGEPRHTTTYGITEEQHVLRLATPNLLYGIDLGEMQRVMADYSDAFLDGDITGEDYQRKVERAANSAIEPRERRRAP